MQSTALRTDVPPIQCTGIEFTINISLPHTDTDEERNENEKDKAERSGELDLLSNIWGPEKYSYKDRYFI